ncbi:hypothetical protein FVER53590_26009 [Fusarium verticillioides]|nr:hypothetical protein FVER53590_26009 [Fusarium verticillioides]
MMTPWPAFWKLFNSIQKGHHENRLARADYHALKQALPHLKRLESLVLTNRTANDGIDNGFQQGAQSLESSSPVFKFWRRFESKTYYPVSFAPRCDWVPTSKSLLDKTPIYGIDCLDDRLTDDITPCGVPNTLAGSPAFKELVTITLFAKQSPFPTRLAKGFGATNITKFNLTLGTGAPLDVGVGERLRTIFESMPQLEELFFEPHDIHHFSAIPTEKTFPRLRKITFNCGLMRLEQLFKFLRSHGATLKSLVVEHCKIALEPENELEDMLPMLISELRSLHRDGALKLENGLVSELCHGAVPQTCCAKLYGFRDEYNVTWDYEGNGVWERREEVDSEDDL